VCKRALMKSAHMTNFLQKQMSVARYKQDHPFVYPRLSKCDILPRDATGVQLRRCLCRKLVMCALFINARLHTRDTWQNDTCFLIQQCPPSS